MGKGNLQKKHWGLKKSHSNLKSPRYYGAMTAASTSEPSLYPHVQLGSPRASRGLFHKLWDRLFKSHSNGGAHQSPKPVTPPVVTANSSGQDISLARTSQAPSPTTAPTPDGNPGQATNPGTVSSEVGLSHAGAPDPKESIAVAYDAAAVMSGPSGMIENITSATDDGRSGLQTIDNFSSIIEPLKVFNTIANQIANIHPYSQVVMSIFTGVSKMILNQKELDNAVRGLLEKISGIYTFMNEDGRLNDVLSIQALCAKMARQILECAVFITHYSQTTNFWKRLGKHIVDETDAAVGIYNGVLDSLLQQFRDRVTRDTVVHVHHMVEDMDFRDMAYADGAGWETSKCCLTGTREDILSRIRSWIDTTGRDVPRVLWLSGTAGKGKSAIAHTIAEWFYERSGTGACFCFDSTRGADRHHEKIFTTIARDLADRDPVIRRALASAVHDNELRRTKDIKRQWKKLILGPVDAVSKVIDAPVLIIIDALDENGDVNFRQQVLCLLASPPTELPANFRVLVTSRPLKDIHDSLSASRVLCLSLDDDISPKSAESDIQHYISGRLGNMCDVFSEADFQMLAQKADGLFEWARLACEYIQHTNTVGRGSKSRFEAVVSQAAGKETPMKGTRLLDDMYRRVLGEILPEEDREEAIPLFCSVMGQILASQEPLPKAALTAMRSHFPRMDSRYTVDDVIGPMGSLVTGTGDSQTPIRPLHASFYDFLTDKSRSDKFFIDVPSVQADLAFASLQVMKHGLRFNICSLESSYLPNSDVSDLEKRVKESIVPELSYSCRFWGTHAGATPIEPLLAKEVKAFFDGDHLLFWIEALSLLKSVGSAVQTLSSVADWCQDHAEYMDISDTARDTLRFIRTSGAAILRSTPHLYLSALPFSPTQSSIFKKFAEKFSCTPRVVAGHVVAWPPIEKILRAHAPVHSVAISLDEKRVACGLRDGTIQIWDGETGEALDVPFKGHIDCVQSITISSDGKRVVSGSRDTTIRMWDANTGTALGPPLQGHTGYVSSVAISSDGRRVVSGSHDTTIQVWDADTGKALGPPLRGHTGKVSSVAISLDGKCIVSGAADNTILVWDADSGKKLRSLGGHTDKVSSVTFSLDGKYIVSGSVDKTIRLWDVETGKALGAPLQGHTNRVDSVATSRDGKCIVSGSADKTLRVWDDEAFGAILYGHNNPVPCDSPVATSPERDFVASNSHDTTIGLWDVEPSDSEAYSSRLEGHTDVVLSVAISPDGKHIVSGSVDSTVRVWDPDTRKALCAPLGRSTTSWATCVAISPDGNYIVSGSRDNMVRVWDMVTGKALNAPFRGHRGCVQSIAISSDGKRVVSGSHDRTIRVWDVDTGKSLGAPLEGHTDKVYSVAISSDGKRVVSGSHDMTIQVWDADTSKALGPPLKGHTSKVSSVAISSDGKLIVSGSHDQTVRMWDAETGKALYAPLQGHSNLVLSVAISPDGTYIASGSRDNTIRVWDVKTGKVLGAPLTGHTNMIRSVAISPDGRHIVSGSNDYTIRVWDINTREALGAPLRGHSGSVHSIAISPDGKYVSCSLDGTIRVWDVEHQYSKARAICFSPNPTYALCSPFSFLRPSRDPASLSMNEEGWVMGPEGRLLLWIPISLYPLIYAPCNTLVISDFDISQLDLSRFAHGSAWVREQHATSS